MTDNLYDALEICLQALEKGVDIESCLVQFPALADELRPILETATAARAQAIESIPADAMRRGRARVLQHAAEIRESQRVAASLPFWRKPIQFKRSLRTLATSLSMVVFLFSGGTGLVFASSGSLPGDNLYPVKRSWEGVQLVLIADPKTKHEREKEFEHERLEEIHELFSESRQTQVDFQGVVEKQQAAVWQIAGLQIAMDDDAVFIGEIVPGALVRVVGETEDGIIKAEQISLIQAPSATQTPVATVRPLNTSTLRPTAEPSETKEREKTPEPRETEKSDDELESEETEKPERETPEPEETDKPDKKPTEKKPPDDDGGGGGDDD